jgi:hypothetical protein
MLGFQNQTKSFPGIEVIVYQENFFHFLVHALQNSSAIVRTLRDGRATLSTPLMT